MVEKVLIATRNVAKKKEYQQYFLEFLPAVRIVTLDEVDSYGAPTEDGKTFLENAYKKAVFYAKQTGLTTIGDDGGFEIDALGGQPGVLSRRWPGYEASDQELVDLVFTKLRGVPKERRTARFTTAAVVVKDTGEVVAKEQGSVAGVIPKKPAPWIQKDFPFRAVLYFPKYKKYFQDLSEKEHQEINHRRALIQKISIHLGNT